MKPGKDQKKLRISPPNQISDVILKIEIVLVKGLKQSMSQKILQVAGFQLNAPFCFSFQINIL